MNLSECIPARGTGAPERTRSHYARILALLRERGPSGVLSSERYDAPQLYGRSPRNRISIRHDGHLVKTVAVGASVVRYVLARENPSPSPRPPQCKAKQSAFPESPDWYTATTGKPRPGVDTESLFLFDRGRRQ